MYEVWSSGYPVPKQLQQIVSSGDYIHTGVNIRRALMSSKIASGCSKQIIIGPAWPANCEATTVLRWELVDGFHALSPT